MTTSAAWAKLPPELLARVELSAFEAACRRSGKERVIEELSRTMLGAFIPDLPPEWASVPASAPGVLPYITQLHAHKAQLPPEGAWKCWVLTGGRGSGKGWAGSRWLIRRAQVASALIAAGRLTPAEARFAVIGATHTDLRRIDFEGPSGLVAACPPWYRGTYSPGLNRLELPGGVEIHGFSGEEGDRLRGSNFRAALLDEFCSFADPDNVWLNLSLALRVGEAQCAITTTPRSSLKIFRTILAAPSTVVTKAETASNLKNLNAAAIADRYALYGGTFQGAEELRGELVDDTGAEYFARADVQIVADIPGDIVRSVRRWDLAATVPGPQNPDPDWSCGVRMGKRANGKFAVTHVVFARVGPGAVEDLVLETAAIDGRETTISLAQDPGGAGRLHVFDLVRKLAGYDVITARETGSKEVRAKPLSAQWSHGNVEIVRGSWNEQYLEMMEAFPSKHAHDDAPDASSGAFAFLAELTGGGAEWTDAANDGLWGLAHVLAGGTPPPRRASADTWLAPDARRSTGDDDLPYDGDPDDDSTLTGEVTAIRIPPGGRR